MNEANNKDRSQPPGTTRRVEQPVAFRPTFLLWVSAIFGGLTLSALLVIIYFRPESNEQSRFAIIALFSLGVGLSSAFLGGDAFVRGKMPGTLPKGLLLSATGGLAITLVLFFTGPFVLKQGAQSGPTQAQFEDLVKRIEERGVAGSTYGVRRYLPPVSYSAMFDMLKSGGVMTLHDTLIPDFANSVDAMKAAIVRGGTVRILVIHPDAATAKMRADEISPKWNYTDAFRPGMIAYLSHLRSVAQDLDSSARPRLIVAIYDDLPSMPIYLIDNPGETEDTIFHGYFLSVASIEVPHVEFRRERGGLFETFETYVNNKWKKAVPGLVDIGKCTNWATCLGRPRDEVK